MPDYQIEPGAGLRRWVLLAGLAGLFAVTLWVWSGPFRASWMTRNNSPDPQVYERAAELDPSHSDYAFVLGQIYNYSTQFLDFDKARSAYDSAVRLNPDRSAHWLELSKFHEQTGNADGARSAMAKALEVDPNYAQVYWAAANLEVRLGSPDDADPLLRRSAELDPSYVIQVIDLAWRLHGDPRRILNTLIPDTTQALTTALSFFVQQKNDDGAAIAWERVKSREFHPDFAYPYVDFLIERARPADAYSVFMSRFPNMPGRPFNGSFEKEIANNGFDWRIHSIEHADVRRDTTSAREGVSSLLVVFDGKDNPDFAQVWQYLPVVKGQSYTLRFWMKTDALTSSEGAFVEVDGKRSEPRLGTNYWEEFAIPFTASSDMVLIRLRRMISRKLDSAIKGRVWFDGFTLIDNKG